MRSRAEKKKQFRNALLASAISLLTAGIIVLVTVLCFNTGLLITVLIFAISFAFALAILIILWKKTDLIRNLMYCFHCIKYPESSRKYYCPCCGRKLAGFTDMKYYEDPERFDPSRFMRQRQDVICPFCYSAPRQRILASWGNNNIQLLRNSKILYFAPEYSMMKWFRRNNISLTTADLYDTAADLKLDITNISLPDGSYDIVIANHVLEHVSSYQKALYELNRILRPNGMLLVSFPINTDLDTVAEGGDNTSEDRIRLFGQNDHVRIFGNDSSSLLRSFEFTVNEIELADIGENILPVTGPADYDSNRLFICVK